MSPKVSVIVPVYNVSEYLGQCLDSILLQTLQDIEVICVNDGSTDDSLDILQGYAMFDERLKIISQENAGAGAARNNGIKHATGEYIICLDSDDFFEPDMLEKMVQKAEEDGSDVVVCGYIMFDNKTTSPIKVVLPQLPDNLPSPFTPNDCPEKLFTFMSPNAWTKLFRTSYIKKEEIFFDNTPSSNDVLFVCAALTLAKKISVITEPFIYYRINTSTQISFNKTKDIIPLLTTLNNLYLFLKSKNIINFNNYFHRLHASLIYELTNRSKNNKIDSLMAIRKILPNEVVQNIFSSGNQPAVSIIVPVYNAAPFLPECLDSCLNQTLKEIEIICVDDGSTDNSLEILNAYAQKDNRIKVIHQENQGLPITRNNALKIATGEYIQYLDSDDYLLPESCECLYLYAKIFNLEMVFFTARDFQNETNETEDIPYHQLTWLPDNFISVFSWQNVKEVMQLVAVTACLTFYKHDFLKEHNIHWINKKIYYEDSPYFVEAFLQAKRVGALKENFYQRRLHGQNTTLQMNSNFPDYCKVAYLTLKIAKQYADDIAFFKLFHGYTLKAYYIYKDLSKESQQKFKPTLFALYETLKSLHKLDLLEEVEKWYQDSRHSLRVDTTRYNILFKEEDYKCELKEFYEKNIKNTLNLHNPKTYNEKMQWLKLYNSTPLKTQLADKYLVRDWVKEKIGEEYLIPLLGVYDKFEEIDFDKLPHQFVIKCNHGCGWNIIVSDKSKLDLNDVKNKLDKWLNTNFAFQNGMELHYRDIQPKIIIEQFIQNKEAKDLYDYKFWCFNGKVHYIQFLSERSKHLKMAFYDRDWNKQNFVYSYPLDDKIIEKPNNLNEMIDLSEKLSQDFPHIRVDFYRLDNGTIYFGEMTFSSASGSCKWNNEDINYKLGELIKLPELAYNLDTGEYYKIN